MAGVICHAQLKRGRQIKLETSCAAIQSKQRGFTMRRMAWQGQALSALLHRSGVGR